MERSRMSETILEGVFQCVVVRYYVTGAPVMTAICHCSMCRRANASPSVAWAMFQEQQANFTGAHPKLYASSEQAQRGFCELRGTPLSFSVAYIPGLIDLTLDRMDQPDTITPPFNYWHSQHLARAEFEDSSEQPLVGQEVVSTCRSRWVR